MLVALFLQVATQGSPIVDGGAKHVERKIKLSADEKKTILFKSFTNAFTKHFNGERTHSRFLAEGDWDFLNDYFDMIGEIQTDVNETFKFSNIDFNVKNITCNGFSISDIEIESAETSNKLDLTVFISGISLQCELAYE